MSLEGQSFSPVVIENEKSAPEVAEKPSPEVEKPKISLERNLPYECNIEYNPDHFYRAMGLDAYEDFLKTKIMTANKYSNVYFQKGFANKRYVKPGAENIKAIIVETNSQAGFSVEERSGYARVGKIELSQVEKGEIPIRIWIHKGGNHWEAIFDTFPQNNG